MDKKTIRDVGLKGKKALVRVDFNVPMDEEGRITDENRIQAEWIGFFEEENKTCR